jgi:alkylation response protein AidB-like acyl-CoA dehydrogenase
MDMLLEEKHRAVRQSVRRFCDRELRPIAAQIDQEARFPWEVVEKMGKLGYFGIQVPEKIGRCRPGCRQLCHHRRGNFTGQRRHRPVRHRAQQRGRLPHHGLRQPGADRTLGAAPGPG